MLSPQRYTETRIQELTENVTAGEANAVLNRADPELIVGIVGVIPRGIPKNSRAKMHNLIIAAYLDALYKHAAHKYSVAAKKHLMRCTLRYAQKVRES